jgi:hypothetical protein
MAPLEILRPDYTGALALCKPCLGPKTAPNL